jgi:hypothetical protein
MGAKHTLETSRFTFRSWSWSWLTPKPSSHKDKYRTINTPNVGTKRNGRHSGRRPFRLNGVRCKSYGQTPLESHLITVRIERFVTFEVTLLIKLTPKFPRNVAPTVFPVPPN